MKWFSKKKVSTIFHVIEIKFSVLERYFVTQTSVESFQQFFFLEKKETWKLRLKWQKEFQ